MTSSDGELGAFGDVGAMLSRTVDSGRISPSYLFEGVDREDLRDAALAFAAAVLARGSDAGDPDAVRRRVIDGEHPDLHVIEKDKLTVISVAALATQLEQAHQKPLEGTHQVFLVDPAEAMEPEGVARYLKALEEPPLGTVFVLVSTQPDRLPATVLSRVRRIRLPPMEISRIARRLLDDGVPDDAAPCLASWSGGSLARARRMASTGIGQVAPMLVDAASGQVGVAAAVDRASSALERGAAAWTESVGEGGPDPKRQHVRVLLADLIHLLSVEARDRAAGRRAPMLEGLTVDRALRALVRLGDLTAAVHANVSPAVILLEIVRTLRCPPR